MIGAHVDGHNGSVVLLDGIQVVHPFDLNFHYVEQEEFIPICHLYRKVHHLHIIFKS
jgi:hypothetical protein